MDSIGSRLKSAREKKGISLDKAQSDTKIRLNVLKALEEDRADDILNQIYVKGFLRKYSQYLGLDSESIVEEYLSRGPRAPEQVLVLEGERIPAQRRKLLLPLTIVLIFISAIYLFYRISLKMESTTGPQTSKIVSVDKVAVEKAKEAPVPSTQRREPSGVEPVRLTIRTKDDVWLQVKSDGKVVFQDILSAQSTEKWEASERIELWVGKAEAVELLLNDVPLASPGKGVIKGILITKDGMKIQRR